MSVHYICFSENIRKISVLWAKKSTLSGDMFLGYLTLPCYLNDVDTALY